MPAFDNHDIATVGSELGQTSLVDVDSDGDLDFIAGERGGQVRWFEFTGNPDLWNTHTIGDSADTDVGGTAIDVDGDGFVDQVSGTVWYRNPASPANPLAPRTQQFSRHVVMHLRTHDTISADIDGDAHPDILAMSDAAAGNDTLRWYRIQNRRESDFDPDADWHEQIIGDGVHGGIDSRGVGDLDGDRDLDVVRSTGWYENRAAGTDWVWHGNIDGGSGGQYPDASKSWIADLNADRANDIIMVTANAEPGEGRVAIFWNDSAVPGSSFTRQLIAADKGDLHSLAVADFDNDGDLDIFSGEGPSGGSTGTSNDSRRGYIWENTDGLGGTWTEHQIIEGFEIHEAVAGDVDLDGDIDIAFTSWGDGQHRFLRNTLDPVPSAARCANIDNGADLSGWTIVTESKHGDGGLWRIEDGAIVGEQDPPLSGNGGFLASDVQLGDFEVTFEAVADWDVDSGVLLRANSTGQGYQVTFDMQPFNSVAGIYGEGFDNSLREWDFTLGDTESSIRPTNYFRPESWDDVWNVGDWNRISARIQGNPPTIQTWINGRKATRYVGPTVALADRGSVAIQVHRGDSFQGVVQVRNVCVRELGANPALPLPPTSVQVN